MMTYSIKIVCERLTSVTVLLYRIRESNLAPSTNQYYEA